MNHEPLKLQWAKQLMELDSSSTGCADRMFTVAISGKEGMKLIEVRDDVLIKGHNPDKLRETGFVVSVRLDKKHRTDFTPRARKGFAHIIVTRMTSKGEEKDHVVWFNPETGAFTADDGKYGEANGYYLTAYSTAARLFVAAHYPEFENNMKILAGDVRLLEASPDRIERPGPRELLDEEMWGQPRSSAKIANLNLKSAPMRVVNRVIDHAEQRGETPCIINGNVIPLSAREKEKFLFTQMPRNGRPLEDFMPRSRKEIVLKSMAEDYRNMEELVATWSTNEIQPGHDLFENATGRVRGFIHQLRRQGALPPELELLERKEKGAPKTWKIGVAE